MPWHTFSMQNILFSSFELCVCECVITITQQQQTKWHFNLLIFHYKWHRKIIIFTRRIFFFFLVFCGMGWRGTWHIEVGSKKEKCRDKKLNKLHNPFRIKIVYRAKREIFNFLP